MENAPILNTRITSDEFISFVEHPLSRENDFELIDGYVTMMSSPLLNHQRISGYIAREIGNYLKDKRCEILQDFNVFLDDSNVFRPDIMIVCDKSKLSNNGYNGAPEFVVEVISKSTRSNDYSVKCRAYMKCGVKEYWIVDPTVNCVLVYTLNSSIIRHYTFDEVIELNTFQGLAIDFNEILEIIK